MNEDLIQDIKNICKQIWDIPEVPQWWREGLVSGGVKRIHVDGSDYGEYEYALQIYSTKSNVENGMYDQHTRESLEELKEHLLHMRNTLG